MSKDPVKTNLFANRESGQVVRVEGVNDSWASITVLRALPSKFNMGVGEYDSVFVERYVPIDAGDMTLPATYRPPANAALWNEPEPDAARGETPDGVRIGEAIA